MGESPFPNQLSRRLFLQTATAALTASQVAEMHAEQTALRIAPDTKPRKISENLFVLEDTCNVYLLRDGDHGLLIDFGSGIILRHLAELGVTQVDWVLHTHHHRDQAQGDAQAVALGIPIAVPLHERHLFEDVERFWDNRRVFELYDVTNNFFSLTKNVPVAMGLRDYDKFHWRGREIFIQPTPGHTTGSISLMTEVDGRKVVFSGDLMFAAGNVQNLYDLQYFYQEHEGVDLSIYSLDALMKLKPDLLCPSHGREIVEPVAGMHELSTTLKGWFHYWHPGSSQTTTEFEPTQVSQHLFAHPLATSTFYAIISDSGKALFIDYGSASWNFFQVFRDATDTYGHMRFVEHAIDKLRAAHGLKSIDVAIPTHIHDDHLNGFPHLARRYGTRIFCYENMVEILKHPRGRNLGCLLGEPIKVDRILRDNEVFRWEEFEFTVKHSPGHTDYQAALFATIDGKRIAFTGDAFFNYDHGPHLTHNLIYRNDTKIGDYQKSMQNLIEMQTQVVAPGHGEPFALTEEMIRAFEADIVQQDEFFKKLIADPVTDAGLDPSWVQIYPYQAVAVRGQPLALEVRARNHRSADIELHAVLILPAGWMATPSEVKLKIPANGQSSVPVQVVIPAGWRGSYERHAIAADVVADGRYLGQIAEAVVEVRPFAKSTKST